MGPGAGEKRSGKGEMIKKVPGGKLRKKKVFEGGVGKRDSEALRRTDT